MNLTPHPSHSTRQLSTAINAAAFVAEYRVRVGAGVVAATEERWCSAGLFDVEESNGSCVSCQLHTPSLGFKWSLTKQASAKTVPTKLVSAHALASRATRSIPF